MIFIADQTLPLAQDFFERSPVIVARELLGKYLVIRHADGSIESRMITETEAYDGPQDRACHAYKGRTPRNEPLFGPSGHWYVYLCYGIHWLLNVVTGPVNYPSGVLIRGVDGMKGPGVITGRLGIDKRFNGLIASEKTGMWIDDRGLIIQNRDILATARIGVDYAGKEWAGKKWRFVLRARSSDAAPA